MLTFRQAHPPTDRFAVLDLLNEAARWLDARGITQWPNEFGDADDWRTTRIERYIERGETWIVEESGQPIATFTLAGPDPDFVAGWPDDAPSVHVFRLAVARAAAGRNLGGRILDWASLHAERGGAAWLRLDCHRDNTRLHGYYERHGFGRVGTVHHHTRKSGALFQRRAGAIGDTTMTTDRYDPDGTAAIWQAASDLVASMKTDALPADYNAALEQAARALESEARGIRQKNGMYYRVISGRTHYQPLPD